MSAKLVEHTTKHSMNAYLSTLKKTTEHKRNFIFNLGIFIALVSIVGFMLYLKYKERNNVELARKKHIEKRDFILNHLQLYQSMKSNYLY